MGWLGALLAISVADDPTARSLQAIAFSDPAIHTIGGTWLRRRKPPAQ